MCENSGIESGRSAREVAPEKDKVYQRRDINVLHEKRGRPLGDRDATGSSFWVTWSRYSNW